MDVDIAFFLWQIQIQHGKWKFVLHHKGTVAFFNRAVYDVAFNVPVIDKIIFKSTVSSCNKRLADKSRQMNITVSVINWNQIGSAKPGTAREDSPRLSALDGLCGGWYDGGRKRRGRSGAGEDAMKKIDNCENSTVLVALLLAGILLVMGAYRLFSWLCSRGLTDTLTWVLGAAALVLAALGLLLASRSFRRLKELHL